MKLKLTFRVLFILGSLVSFFMLGFAYFLEYRLNLEPCPLCLLQRYILWIIFGFFTVGAIHNGKTAACISYSICIAFLSIMGVTLASRHVWLQYFAPPGIADCMAGLERMLAFKPFLEVLKEVFFHTSAECAKVDFTFLKLSLPAWSLLGFIGFAIFSILTGWLKIKKQI